MNPPPSTTRTCPVIHELISPARNSKAPTRSSGGSDALDAHPKDLAGKTLAATTPGGASDLLDHLVIKLAGLTAGTGPGNVHIDYAGSAQAIIALTTTGRTAGFSAPPPLPSAALAAGIHTIADLTLYPQAIPLDTLAVVVSGPYYQSHKSAVRGMLACIAHADVYARANSAAAESAIEKVLNEPAAYATAAYAGNKTTWNIFPFTRSLAQAALNDLKAAGLASQVKGFSFSSDDTTALSGISGALSAPIRWRVSTRARSGSL